MFNKEHLAAIYDAIEFGNERAELQTEILSLLAGAIASLEAKIDALDTKAIKRPVYTLKDADKEAVKRKPRGTNTLSTASSSNPNRTKK